MWKKSSARWALAVLAIASVAAAPPETSLIASVRHADIESMRRDIDDRAIAIRADEAKNLKSLAKTYSALSAKAAVAIFREMDDATAVKILKAHGWTVNAGGTDVCASAGTGPTLDGSDRRATSEIDLLGNGHVAARSSRETSSSP